MLQLLLIFIPVYAAAVRRMHDTGRSWVPAAMPFLVPSLLVFVIPFVVALITANAGEMFKGFFILTLFVVPAIFLVMFSRLIWMLTRISQPGPNKYGPNPTEVTI